MTTDFRHISNGCEIPTESYSDQPYIVQTDDGAWLCCVTTGPGHEGADGQHVMTMRSTDLGKSWSAPVSVEPGEKRENSYAVMLKAPSGRIFVFYNHNTDNVREVKCCDNKTVFSRVDSLGHYVFKYSDDHGKSWSEKRYDIPIRNFACDIENVYGGTLRFFWNVGRPFILNGTAYMSLHKVGKFGHGFFEQSEGVLLVSSNMLTESDPDNFIWETLPDGDIGLRTPPGGGQISEEHSYSLLSDGSIYCVYRSIDGYPVESYSRDGGHTWATPRYKCFADGRRMKHPRAANFTWRCENGNFLYWFHNHGGRVMRETPGNNDGFAYEDRNPVWLSAGIEIDTANGREIAWSEPEIVLYDDDPYVRMSYPDLVEKDGRYYLTETQKDIARIHEIPAEMLNDMWSALKLQLGIDSSPLVISDEKCLLRLSANDGSIPATLLMPQLPWFRIRDYAYLDCHGKDTGDGITIEFTLKMPEVKMEQILLSNRNDSGHGFAININSAGLIELIMNDGQTENCWRGDDVLKPGKTHHIAVVMDGGPRIISFIIDGRFCDGGDIRQFGWGRFSPYIRNVNGAEKLNISPEVQSLSIYGRALRTSEVIARKILIAGNK